ncbi:phage tail assembly protein [Tardiphaga sp. 20_F10_N6_6]|uniref:phage tail assembly protein n=1 Tax=Tardiphaga sp. 20_F10_N6_6 TaxID=3240788 RepID=UPI003F89AA68
MAKITTPEAEAKFKDNGDGTMTINLSRPLEIDGAKVGFLTMREPTVNDQLVASEAKGSEGIKEVSYFANLCDVTPDDIRRLPVRDYNRVQAAYASFTD